MSAPIHIGGRPSCVPRAAARQHLAEIGEATLRLMAACGEDDFRARDILTVIMANFLANAWAVAADGCQGPEDFAAGVFSAALDTARNPLLAKRGAGREDGHA